MFQYTKILGVTFSFDNLFNFRQHVACQRFNPGISPPGAKKRRFFSQPTRPPFNYNSPIWTSNLCNAAMNVLQATQNGANKTVTDCFKITSSDHLHSECNILLVKDHCMSTMLEKQFHLATRQEHHQNYRPLSTPIRKENKMDS